MLILLIFLSLPLLSFSQPTSGPCFQGTRLTTESMNCTNKGYFELTQCFEKYCVCVDPLTGHEADGTKTFSNRILPKCGSCFIRVAKDISTAGINDRLPICDSGNGKYFGKQCHGSRCTCVDPETGDVKKRGGFELTCESKEQTKIDFSIDSPITGKKLEQIPLASPTCGLSKDRGHACANGQSKVMWYYDTTVYQCLAFRYEGCGGNKNRFNSINECWNSCVFQDFGGCSGMKTPLKDSKGETVICRSKGNGNSNECPDGYKCNHLPFFSICCEQKNEDLFRENTSPKCGTNHTAPVTFHAAGITMNLLGKSCSDKFCPSNSDCKQLQIFAHCCPRS